MTPITLPVKNNTVTLPESWVKDFKVEEVAATTLGDVVIIRPLREVSYTPEAEEKVLEAMKVFEQDRAKGELKELGENSFDDLKATVPQAS